MPRSFDFENEFKVSPASKKDAEAPPNRRISRACDRCRFKKSKCNGQQPCKNCSLNDRTCIYSARRRRDARNWYCGMAETVDEAMQRLYYACSRANSFPGIMPVEQDGRVTTESILTGLGLSTAPPPSGRLETQDSLASSRQETLANGKEVYSDASAGVSSPVTKRQKASYRSRSKDKAHYEPISTQESAEIHNSDSNRAEKCTSYNVHDQFQQAVNVHEVSLYSSPFSNPSSATYASWWQQPLSVETQPTPTSGTVYYTPVTLPYTFDPSGTPINQSQMPLLAEVDGRNRSEHSQNNWYDTSRVYTSNHNPTLAEWQRSFQVLRTQSD